jgi:hypothetical protein
MMSVVWYDFLKYIFVYAVNDQDTKVCKIEMIAFGKYVYFVRVYSFDLFDHRFLLFDIKYLLSFCNINGLHMSVYIENCHCELVTNIMKCLWLPKNWKYNPFFFVLW